MPKHNAGDFPAPPSEVVEAFARAVVRRGERALLLDRDNKPDGWVSVRRASTSGRSFTLSFRSDLLVFDGDGDGASEAALALADATASVGVQAVVWASGRPGHHQVVLRLEAASERKAWRERGRVLGLEPRTRSRPPLSPHRWGLPVTLVRPDSLEAALEILRSPDWRAPHSDRITDRTWDRIRNGDPSARSGSEVVYRIAIALIVAGRDAVWAYSLLMNPTNEGGAALRKRAQRGEAAARRWFYEHVWVRAEAYVAEHPPLLDATTARLAIVEYRREADQCIWSGSFTATREVKKRTMTHRVSAASVRKAFEGVCEIALKAGTICPYISERHLADVGGLGSRRTVRNSVAALIELGWLAFLQAHKGRRASTYRLLLDGTRGNDPQRHTQRVGCT